MWVKVSLRFIMKQLEAVDWYDNKDYSLHFFNVWNGVAQVHKYWLDRPRLWEYQESNLSISMMSLVLENYMLFIWKNSGLSGSYIFTRWTILSKLRLFVCISCQITAEHFLIGCIVLSLPPGNVMGDFTTYWASFQTKFRWQNCFFIDIFISVLHTFCHNKVSKSMFCPLHSSNSFESNQERTSDHFIA